MGTGGLPVFRVDIMSVGDAYFSEILGTCLRHRPEVGMIRYELGVMQGRLLPKYKGRYQAHPVGYWQDEFRVAADAGLALIEFILDFNDFDKNPLTSDRGVDDIAAVMKTTGVRVKSICADYFM